MDSKEQTKALIQKFYDAFSKRDSTTMKSCYADNASFSDEVFPNLQGKDIGRMWEMLCHNGKDLKIDYQILGVSDDGLKAKALWNAYYTFSKTGRKVHNIINAHFEVTNGLIISHRDHFSFWRWTTQALGPVGLLLGWTPIIRNKVRGAAKAGLAGFLG